MRQSSLTYPTRTCFVRILGERLVPTQIQNVWYITVSSLMVSNV